MNNQIYNRERNDAISNVASDNVQRVCNFLYQLSGEKFYGDLNLKFQNGEIVLVNKQESFKPNFLVIVEHHKVI